MGKVTRGAMVELVDDIAGRDAPIERRVAGFMSTVSTKTSVSSSRANRSSLALFGL